MLRLEIPGPRGVPLRSIDLDDMPGVHITEVDLGYPEIREDSEPRVNASGMVDRTKYHNSRVVQITGKLEIGVSRQAVADALAPFLVPSERPVLTVETDNGLRRMAVRANDFSKPQRAGVQDISVSFKVPGGVLEGERLGEATIWPQMPIEGRVYDLTFNRAYPPGNPTSITVINRGSAPTGWLARIYGPCVGPRLEHVGKHQLVSLGRLTIGPDGFVEVNSENHTVFADGNPANSRYSGLVFEATTWWTLDPGPNEVAMYAEQWSGNARTELEWSDSYLL